MSLVAASSLGKCPRFFNTLRSCICKLSMALVVSDDLSHLPADNRRKGMICCQLRRQLSAIIGYFFAPGAGFELAEPLGGGLRGFGPVDGFELASQGLALLPAAKGQAPEELDNHRNGYSKKTVVGEDGSDGDRGAPGSEREL